jgi:hypothetical protein
MLDGTPNIFLPLLLIHIFFVAPLFIWIGFHGKKTEIVYYDVLLFLAVTAFGYNAIKLIK